MSTPSNEAAGLAGGSDLPLADDPIGCASEDLLGRRSYALALADELMTMKADRGAVVGILGPWGSGKTSLMNLVAEQLSRATDVRVVEFNPWLFSGTEQLTALFFAEIESQLRDAESGGDKARRVSAAVIDQLGSYAQALALPLALVPGAGVVADAAGTTAQHLSTKLRGDQSIHGQRRRVEEALRDSETRIVVLLDDIDRLSRKEIRDVFRLVRLTGSFPNIVYLLCFDRAVIEKALTDESIDGRAYLEKILRLTAEVPVAPDLPMDNLIQRGIAEASSGKITGPFDENRWPDVYFRIVRPLCVTLRDVKRLLASLPLTLRAIGTEVGLVDVIALETVRTSMPDLHAGLLESADALTTTAPAFGGSGRETDAAVAEQIKNLLAFSDDPTGGIPRAVLELLFPAAARHIGGMAYTAGSERAWRRDRRIAHHKVFTYYMTRELRPDEAPAHLVDEAADAFGDEEGLTAVFAAAPDKQLEDLLGRLEYDAENVEPERVRATVTVLMTLFVRLRTNRRGMLDFDADLSVTRLILRLLRRLNSEDVVADVVSDLQSAAPTRYAEFELITIVGHRENAGHKLVAEDFAAVLEANLRRRVEGSTATQLSKERHLIRLLLHTLQPSPEAVDPAIPALMEPVLAVALLVDAISVLHSQPIGSYAVTKERHLAWDVLVNLYGTESRLAEAVAAIRDERPTAGESSSLGDALRLYDRYAAGWRPERF